MDKQKVVLPVLFSLPTINQLDLPTKAKLLPQIESGELDHLDFRANVFGTGVNHNPYAFLPEDLPAFCASFEGKPFLRDHDIDEIGSREGTILQSIMDSNGVFVQDIRLTTRTGMTAYIEGQMDRFSIGWDYDDVMCSICCCSYFDPSCMHVPGRTYQTLAGQQTCNLVFINPVGRETSAVNTPAVDGTGIIAALELKHEIQIAGKSASVIEQLSTPKGLEPEMVVSPSRPILEYMDQAGHELANLMYYKTEGAPMNVRELLNQRAEAIGQARRIHDLGETENRDLTEAEHAEFGQLMSQASQLETQIKTLNEERAQLIEAEQSQAVLAGSAPAIKPEAPKNPHVMSRADFNKLTILEQGKFIRSGGKTQD